MTAIRDGLTPTQKRILELLPATPDQLAQALYGRVTASERNLVYVHIALLRRRLSGAARITSHSLAAGGPEAHRALDRLPNEGGYTSRIVYHLEI